MDNLRSLLKSMIIKAWMRGIIGSATVRTLFVRFGLRSA
jgi:hypothetical protein